MIEVKNALTKLEIGNQRFLSSLEVDIKRKHIKNKIIFKQNPFAIILCCSDSRVPPEIIFDQGIGDLFVIRVAGNIVTPSQIGSIEFAVEKFNSPLVVVLGHSDCGAVKTTLELLKTPDKTSPNLQVIIDQISPTIKVLSKNYTGKADGLLATANRANINASVNQLKSGSKLLKNKTENDKLRIVGGNYSIENGEVIFFEI